jgi:subtilase family serine protease
MFRNRRLYAILSSVLLLLIGGFLTLRSQTPAALNQQALIREKPDDSKLVTLAGNTRPEANAANDQGEVSDDLVMDHMMLQLKRSPQQERAVEQFIDSLHDPKSPNFHQWLTAVAFGEKFGVAEADIQAITSWLQSDGFTVNTVYPNRMVIDFSGNAGQVRRALHTSIHNLNVNGVHHIANFSDPQIPAALAPAVAGVVSLHDFQPRKMSRVNRAIRPRYTGSPNGQPLQALAPPDLATIYDFNPLFAKGTTGNGQSIVVIEDTDLYSSQDWTTFRSTFGLSQYTSGSLATVHPAPPSGTNNCSDPGVTSDDDEAILDAEWSSAAAPGAAIVVAACADTDTTSGLLIAGQNLVNQTTPPAIVSISYGGCEAESGASSNAAINSLYQQGVAEGASIFVAAGDEGAASCDGGQVSATHGIGVSSQASTQYNVAVGGTDFSDVLNGTTATYWSNTNTASYGSALSYIPEIPWNDSCAGSLLAIFSGYSTGYGASGFCNSISNTSLENVFEVVAAGSGGPSNCFSGVPATFGVSNGTCQGYPKPSWQTGLSGIPGDGVRDIPDVSMFASDGAAWGHSAIVCFSDPNNDGVPCTGDPGNWAGWGGTSLAAPVMAGAQALVNQTLGGKAQGNPNVVYYALAASTPSVFHSITQGDIDVDCNGPQNCYGFLGHVDYGRGGRIFDTSWAGALSVSDSSFTSAYLAGAAWSFANGIGSVDVNNLVTNWPAPPK